jgi:hypothetical protein
MQICRFLILVYLAYLLILTSMSLVGFPTDLKSTHNFPYLADKPVGEDGFYMLTVAWDIAKGHGITYNYNLPTTGIQPLSTFIYAGLAWIVQAYGGDKWIFIRIVLLFGGISLLVFAHLIGCIARRMTEGEKSSGSFAYAFGLLATLFSYTLFRWFTYGLETGLYLICIALFVRSTLDLSKTERSRPRLVILIGTLGGITILSRLDFAVVLIVFLLISVFRYHLTFQEAFLSGLVATLIVSPWFLYVHRVTHNWLPSSGAAQASLITSQNALFRLGNMAQAVLSHMTPWIYSNPSKFLVAGAFLSLLVLTAFVLRNRDGRESLLLIYKKHPCFANWTFAIMPLVLIYLLFFWAAHFYQRYSAPIFIPFVIILAIMAAMTVQKMPKAVQHSALLILPACFFIWAALTLHSGFIGNGHAISAGFIRERYQSSRVGAFQSGVIGFFNSNVINLDGKVNYSALAYAKRRELYRYVDLERVDILVDWPDYINGALDENWLATHWKRCEAEVPYHQSICLHRILP